MDPYRFTGDDDAIPRRGPMRTNPLKACGNKKSMTVWRRGGRRTASYNVQYSSRAGRRKNPPRNCKLDISQNNWENLPPTSMSGQFSTEHPEVQSFGPMQQIIEPPTSDHRMVRPLLPVLRPQYPWVTRPAMMAQNLNDALRMQLPLAQSSSLSLMPPAAVSSFHPPHHQHHPMANSYQWPNLFHNDAFQRSIPEPEVPEARSLTHLYNISAVGDQAQSLINCWHDSTHSQPVIHDSSPVHSIRNDIQSMHSQSVISDSQITCPQNALSNTQHSQSHTIVTDSQGSQTASAIQDVALMSRSPSDDVHVMQREYSTSSPLRRLNALGDNLPESTSLVHRLTADTTKHQQASSLCTCHVPPPAKDGDFSTCPIESNHGPVSYEFGINRSTNQQQSADRPQPMEASQNIINFMGQPLIYLNHQQTGPPVECSTPRDQLLSTNLLDESRGPAKSPDVICIIPDSEDEDMTEPTESVADVVPKRNRRSLAFKNQATLKLCQRRIDANEQQMGQDTDSSSCTTPNQPEVPPHEAVISPQNTILFDILAKDTEYPPIPCKGIGMACKDIKISSHSVGIPSRDGSLTPPQDPSSSPNTSPYISPNKISWDDTEVASEPVGIPNEDLSSGLEKDLSSLDNGLSSFNKELLSQDKDMPNQEKDLHSKDKDLWSQDKDQPSQEKDLPSQDKDQPSQEKDLPSQDKGLPSQDKDSQDLLDTDFLPDLSEMFSPAAQRELSSLHSDDQSGDQTSLLMELLNQTRDALMPLADSDDSGKPANQSSCQTRADLINSSPELIPLQDSPAQLVPVGASDNFQCVNDNSSSKYARPVPLDNRNLTKRQKIQAQEGQTDRLAQPADQHSKECVSEDERSTLPYSDDRSRSPVEMNSLQDTTGDTSTTAAKTHTDSPSPDTQAIAKAKPKLCVQWTVQEVAKYISGLPDCQRYAGMFRKHMIDGEALSLLTPHHLTNIMKIRLGPAVKICASVDKIDELTMVDAEPKPADESKPKSGSSVHRLWAPEETAAVCAYFRHEISELRGPPLALCDRARADCPELATRTSYAIYRRALFVIKDRKMRQELKGSGD